MLKRRLILALTINDGQLCRTKHFRPDRTYSMDFVDLDGADELVIIDVSKQPSGEGRGKFLGVVEKLSQELFLPLAVGGHVDSWDYARDLMNAGADKIVVNNYPEMPDEPAIAPMGLIEKLVSKLGSSSVVGRLTMHKDLLVPPADIGIGLEIKGVGEILFQNVVRDGSLLGYDIPMISRLADLVNIPVIAMSGCGTPQHMIEGFKAGASACATSNIFHFTPTHVRRFRETIQKAGIDMRPV